MSTSISTFDSENYRRTALKQILPSIASQMIILLYNLADTYFVGTLNSPVQTAAVTIVYPAYVMLTAVANLFGVGGASLIARSLGKKNPDAARSVSSIAFYGGLVFAVGYSILFAGLMSPILRLCGAGEDTLAVTRVYAFWVIVIGGVPAVLSMILANVTRARGDSVAAFWGVSLGGILNILLDPFFIFPRFLNFGAAGAGMATALSNLASCVFFIVIILKAKADTPVSLSPRLLKETNQYLADIMKIGIPSAIQYVLTVVAIAAQSHFVSAYTTEAVAALGIIKKMDQLPLYVSIGTANGMLPILAYFYASEKRSTLRKSFRFGCAISLGFSLLCFACYELFAPALTGIFIDDPQTIAYAAAFLRRMVVAMPITSICYPLIILFQATGKAKEALVVSILRKGVLDLPLLFLMDWLFPLYGCMWVQPIVDTISLITALAFAPRVLGKDGPAGAPAQEI